MRNGSGAGIEGAQTGLTFHATAGFLRVLSIGSDGYDFVMIIAEPDS
jgi:hypothetical protein